MTSEVPTPRFDVVTLGSETSELPRDQWIPFTNTRYRKPFAMANPIQNTTSFRYQSVITLDHYAWLMDSIHQYRKRFSMANPIQTASFMFDTLAHVYKTQLISSTIRSLRVIHTFITIEDICNDRYTTAKKKKKNSSLVTPSSWILGKYVIFFATGHGSRRNWTPPHEFFFLLDFDLSGPRLAS